MCVSMCDFLGRVHGLDNFMMVTAKKVVYLRTVYSLVYSDVFCTQRLLLFCAVLNNPQPFAVLMSLCYQGMFFLQGTFLLQNL